MIPGIGQAAQLGCILEATARKPGNVHRFQDLSNLTYLDLLMSAIAIGPVLEMAPVRTVGETVLACIQATRQFVNTNANLGIVLLLAPLAKGRDIETTLSNLDVADARLVYQAIRLAQPGGLGTADEQDVSGEPTVGLRKAMALAAYRDSIARQYATNFADVLAGAAFLRSLETGVEERILALQRWFLARLPDSLIARKRGDAEAAELQALAQSGADLEPWFAAAVPHRNPGTTADLVCASLFVALRTGIIPVPLSPPWKPHLP